MYMLRCITCSCNRIAVCMPRLGRYHQLLDTKKQYK